MQLRFAHGILINDTEGLLEGNGKQTRYVQIRRQQDNSSTATEASHTGSSGLQARLSITCPVFLLATSPATRHIRRARRYVAATGTCSPCTLV